MGVGVSRLTTRGGVTESRRCELEQLLGSARTLEQVIRALDGVGLQLADVIPMDEFTIDILVDLPDGLTLVFDTT